MALTKFGLGEGVPSVTAAASRASTRSRQLYPAVRAFASQPALQDEAQTRRQMPPFEHRPAPYSGPSKEEVMVLRKRHLSPGAQTWLVRLPTATAQQNAW